MSQPAQSHAQLMRMLFGEDYPELHLTYILGFLHSGEELDQADYLLYVDILDLEEIPGSGGGAEAD